jgi:Na+-transporting NADH:ubiquinone oxidoreductase subunit F
MPNPPKVLTAKLADRQVLNEKFTQYHFELVEPNRMAFDAGQYVSMSVDPAGHRRSYSICSTPDNDHAFELFVDVAPHGMGVQFLESLQFGDTVSVLAPMGQFIVQSEDPTVPLVFVASGSGIAPLRSMLYDQLQKHGSERRMMWYWGLRHEEDMCWTDDLKDLVASYSNVTFHPTISQALPEWPLCRGRVTDCLRVHDVDVTAHYYVCGNQQMILDTIEVLKSRGVPEQQIFHEKFY